MPNPSEQPFWYTLHSQPPFRLNRLKPIIYDWLLTEKKQLQELFVLPEAELQTRYALTAADMEKWAQTIRLLPECQWEWESLKNRGLEMAVRTDDAYPETWRKRLPPEQAPMLVYFRGNPALAAEPGVLFGGDSTGKGAADGYSLELAINFAAEGLNVIGLHNDVVTGAAARSALTAGGPAIILLSQGLDTFDAAEYAGPLAEERLLLVSPFPPATPARLEHATAVSRLAYALASMLITTAPQPGDALWPQLLQSLAEGTPVFIDGHEESKDSLEVLWQKGAQRLQRDTDFQLVLESLYLGYAGQQAGSSSVPAVDTPSETGLRQEDSPPLLPDEALSALQKWGKVPEKLQRRLAEQ